jgi:cytochrome c-type biogenesis protein CcmH/NrfF
MSTFSPDQPWLYLLIWGSFMVLLILAGIIISFIRRSKKNDETEEAE